MNPKLHARTAALAAGFALSALASTAPAFAAPTPQKDVLVMKDGRVFSDLEATQKDGYVSITLRAGEIRVDDPLVDILLEEGKEIGFVPQTEEERKYFEEEGMVRYKGDWMRAGTAKRIIEKELEERLEEAEEDLQHKRWVDAYQEETRDFAWRFTTAKRVAERYMAATDAYYDIFKKDWRVKRDRGKNKLSIDLFDTRAQYLRAGDGPPGALGFFRFVGDYDLKLFYDRQDPEFTMYVLFHEIGHYLHKLLDEDFKMPHWPGESVCEYYGAAKLSEDGRDLTVGLIPNNRLAAIRGDIESGEKIELKEMISTKGFEDYTWGWSFVHMLMQDRRRAKDFKDFFVGLAQDRDVQRVHYGVGLKTVEGDEVLRYFMECMDLDDDEDLEELEKEWYAYITEELEFEGAGAMFWEAKSLRQVGEFDQAREVYKKAFEEDGANAKANDHYAYSQLLMLAAEFDDAIDHLEKAVNKAPLTAEFRWDLGRVLELKAEFARADEDELLDRAAKQKALAIELDPSVEDRGFRISF